MTNLHYLSMARYKLIRMESTNFLYSRTMEVACTSTTVLWSITTARTAPKWKKPGKCV